MVRKRVLSFMSHFSGSHSPVNSEPKSIHDDSTSTPSTPPNGIISSLGNRQSLYPGKNPNATKSDFFHRRGHARAASSTVPASPLWVVDHDSSPLNNTPITVADHNRCRSRSSSRPLSMVQTYQPPRMDVTEDTIPELQPIFTFLNSHANKLYQEGYFLKLDDQNTQGKPNPDRTWTECFAQLVGTVLSLWDAAELDAAGEDGEVLPKFINLTDASIKMIESLPTRSNEEQSLQNILSISTAGRNRYLLHFNSRQSLIQWTSGIRLAMFEHSTLQEAYTGALIAGKGKQLNNIGVIMERSRVHVDQWVRVRFGAGVPWRRCWCVISPPDEKEYQKAMKEHKKKNPYDRSHPPILKGDIKFYEQRKEGKKQKKSQPIATINDAYSAYALYPQSKSLIDASTLIKIEGDITIHADPPSSTEGFVFIMPEVNPAVSGFEMMLRFLFPTWDTFGLYGRPGRLVASVLDSRSLMFAMPKHKRYGYLELLDVSSLILTDGNASRNEREWRKKLKELTGTRMNTATDESESSGTSRANSRTQRRSFGPAASATTKPRVGFADEAPPPPTGRASRSTSLDSDAGATNETSNTSDAHLAGPTPPQVPRHNESPYSVSPSPGFGPNSTRPFVTDFAAAPEPASSEEARMETSIRDFDGIRRMQTPEPVSQPPTFSHAPGDKPNNRPYHSPEMRRANSRLSINTLEQLANAGNISAGQGLWSPEAEMSNEEQKETFRQDPDQRDLSPVHLHSSNTGMPANTGSHEALMKSSPLSPSFPSDMDPMSQRTRSPFNPATGTQPDSRGPTPTPRPKTPISRPGTATGNRPPGPPNYGNQGNHPAYRGPPPAGPPPGPPGMPPPGRGRGRPPPNMAAPGRGYPGNGPQGMYSGYNPGPPGAGGSGGPRSPPPNRGERLPALDTSPIHRKPLPVRSDSLHQRSGIDGVTPVTESSSSASFTGHRIDAAGFGQVRAQNASSPAPQPGIVRYDTMISQASSRYDDGASTSSPDYASSRPSTETASSVVERPRAGVLKTVGAREEPVARSGGSSFEIPGIDFGPTLNYAAAPRNMPSSGGIGTSQPSNPSGPRAQSPAAAFPQRPPMPEASHGRQGSEENVRKSVIWQPASAVAGPPGSGGPSLSAEEFVQQRAATATPLYAHQRHSSGNTLAGYRAGTPTPPLGRGQDKDYIGTTHSRNSSYDLLQRPSSRGPGEIFQRPKSGELLQRPGSRGAGAVLGGQQSQGESQLSAREQEHVARITGSPLINMAGNKNAPQTGGGLVHAIQVREREREQMKHGWTSQAAQNAIQRQQQPAYPQYQQPMASPSILPPPAGMYSNMGRGMVPPSPRQQGFGMPRGYGGFEQEGNWAPNSGGFRSPPPGNLDPRFMSPQGQFSSSPPFSPGPKGGSGGARGQSPYHGQAF